MAVPLEMPTGLVFNSKTFNIGHIQQLNPSGDVGFIQTLNRASPVWFAEYKTPPLRGERYDEARSFFDRLEGSMNSFLAYDPRRPMPGAYMSSPLGDSVWGSARIVTQDYPNSTISLDNITNGAIIRKGDYISVQVNSVWYLFRAQDNRVASGNIVANLLVKPRPNIQNLVNTVVRYSKACIEMKVLGDVNEEDSVDSFPSFSFKAAQFTRRAPI